MYTYKPSHEEKLIRWKKALKRLRLNPKQAAARLGVNSQTAYNWNCGAQSVPEARLRAIEEMK